MYEKISLENECKTTVLERELLVKNRAIIWDSAASSEKVSLLDDADVRDPSLAWHQVMS